MAQSLKAKFNGKSSEVVSYAKQFGIFRAMEHYEVKDYIAMSHFLEQTAPDVNFPMANYDPDDFGQPNAFDKLLQAMLRKYDKLNAQNAELQKQNAALKRDLDYFKATRWRDASVAVQAILKETGG